MKNEEDCLDCTYAIEVLSSTAPDFREEIGAILSGKLKEISISKRKLARQANISFNTLQNILSGKEGYNIDKLFELISYMGISITLDNVQIC